MTTSVRVRVPATSANLGPGYDALGLALALYDMVDVQVEPDLPAGRAVVAVAGEGSSDVPSDERHLVVCAVHRAMRLLGVEPPGLRLTCVNSIPHSRGLGSSAAAVVAGLVAGSVLAADQEVGDGVGPLGALTSEQLLAEASAMEGHPDNAAPCLVGGLTIAWADADGPRAVSAAISSDVVPVVLIPEHTLATKDARGLLPDVVDHADAARTAGRAALLMTALAGHTDFLLPATDDWLHQRYRAVQMPATARLVAELRDAGQAAVVSGAGPSVLVLATPATVPVVIGMAPPDWAAMPIDVAAAGVRVV